MGNQKRIYARRIAARAARPAKAKDPPTELAAPVNGAVYDGLGTTGVTVPLGQTVEVLAGYTVTVFEVGMQVVYVMTVVL